MQSKNNQIIRWFHFASKAVSSAKSWLKMANRQMVNNNMNMNNVLLSPISRLCRTRTPWIHDSKTCAPCAPSELLLKSKCKPAVDSLHAKPSNKCFNASNGNLHDAIFRCLRLNELVKNCLNDGGISLPFLVLKKLCDTFKRAKCVEHPRKSAPNNYKIRRRKKSRKMLRQLFKWIVEHIWKWKSLTFSKNVSVADKSKYSRTFGWARKLYRFYGNGKLEKLNESNVHQWTNLDGEMLTLISSFKLFPLKSK